jgi:hypothetical protein
MGISEPYAPSHRAWGKDTAFQEEALNIARALANAVMLHRAGKWEQPEKSMVDPQPK